MKSGDQGWIVHWFKTGGAASGAKSGAMFFESREAADKYVEKKRAEETTIVTAPLAATVELNEAATKIEGVGAYLRDVTGGTR